MKEKQRKRQAKKNNENNNNKLQLSVHSEDCEDDGDYSQTLNEQPQCAGFLQKFFQLSEGCLESLPEAIMQSVYLIRSYNDPRLRGDDGSFTNYLIIISVLASILSIANKYVWIDEIMVNVYCRSIIVSLQTLLEHFTFKMIKSSEGAKFNSLVYCSTTAKQIGSYVVSGIVYQHIKSGRKEKNEKQSNTIESLNLTSIDWKNIKITDAMIDVARGGKKGTGGDLNVSDSERDEIPRLINGSIPHNVEWLKEYYEAIKKREYQTKWAIYSLHK